MVSKVSWATGRGGRSVGRATYRRQDAASESRPSSLVVVRQENGCRRYGTRRSRRGHRLGCCCGRCHNGCGRRGGRGGDGRRRRGFDATWGGGSAAKDSQAHEKLGRCGATASDHGRHAGASSRWCTTYDFRELVSRRGVTECRSQRVTGRGPAALSRACGRACK